MYITTKFDVSIQLEFPLRALKVAICMILREDYKTSDYIIILVWEKFFLSRLSIRLLCYITAIKQSAKCIRLAYCAIVTRLPKQPINIPSAKFTSLNLSNKVDFFNSWRRVTKL